MTADTSQIKAALEATHKFSNLAEIQEGANAFAFKGHHIHLDREVFLKVYDYIESVSSEVLREPSLLVKATQTTPPCPNLVQVFDAEILRIQDQQYLCLQMEWVSGRSLLSQLKTAPFGQQDAVRLTADILHGLAHLHRRHMLHRDLKPANILLAEATPKITDFGSVAVLGQGEKFAQASKHSALYVPPEGWESPSRYTFASDLYQVGIVLYELANGPLVYEADHWLTDRVLRTIAKTGKPFSELDPFEQSRLVDLSIAERAGKQTLLAHGRAGQPYFSAKIKRVVRSATHPDLARRYGSAEEFLFQITTIDVPNWRPSSAIPFEAQSWHGWDWRLQFKHKKSGAEVLVERSRPGTQKWRKFPNKVFVDILDAFTFIEAL